MDPDLQAEATRHVAELHLSFRWREAFLRMAGFKPFARLAVANRFWADSFRIASMLAAIEAHNRVRAIAARAGVHI